MSKYSVYTDVHFNDAQALKEALAAVGYPEVEVGQRLPLFGYHNDQRPETAEVVVRRHHIHRSANDLGFTRTDAGLVPVISEWDRGKHNDAWLTKLRVAYQEAVVQRAAQLKRGSVTRTMEGNKIVLRVQY